MKRVTGRHTLGFAGALLFSAAGVAVAQDDIQVARLDQDGPDAKFLEEAVRGDLAEVKMGELALERGQSEAVREFGEMLVEDHSKAMKETAELAQDLGVIPPAQPTAEHMRKHDALARLSGAEFDREFAAEMVKGHEEAIAKYEQQARSGDSKVAEHAEDLLPTLREHLAVAQRLESGATHTEPHD